MAASMREWTRWRLNGGIQTIVKALKQNEDSQLRALDILEKALVDLDCNYEFGLCGGHQVMLRLALSEVEDISEAASRCITMLSSVDCLGAFPVAGQADYDMLPPPAVEQCGLYLHGIPGVDGDLLPYAPSPLHRTAAELGLQPIDVLAHAVPVSTKRMTGQADVGQVLWPAAPCLARWAVAHRGWLAGKRILEVGAGMGLSGIAAGLYGAVAELEATTSAAQAKVQTSVTLTDYVNSVVLANLRHNVRLNSPTHNAQHPQFEGLVARCLSAEHPAPGGGGGGGGGGLAELLSVRALDWDAVSKNVHKHTEGGDGAGVGASEGVLGEGRAASDTQCGQVRPDELYDVILGSDMICCTSDAEGVAAVVTRHLRVGGFAAFLLPLPRTRYGVEALPAAMHAAGLHLETRAVNPLFLSEHSKALEEAHRVGQGMGMEQQANAPSVTSILSQRADESVTAGGYEASLVLHIVTKRMVNTAGGPTSVVAPHKVDALAAALAAGQRATTWGMSINAHTFCSPSLDRPYAQLQHALERALGACAYVYPAQHLHITVSSLAPFTHTTLATDKRDAFEATWLDILRKECSSADDFPRAPFPLVYDELRLDPSAAIFVIKDPTGAIARIRRLLARCAERPVLAPYAESARMRTPAIIHSTFMRFASSPVEAGFATPDMVQAAFDSAASAWEPITVMADALLVMREVVPYMHMDVGGGIEGSESAAHAHCIRAALPYRV